MDKLVLDAMARWPNVPDVFGWLSLNLNGQWRLHPGGTATEPGTPGEAIGNAQINGFIHRNYAHDDQGRWYFQNGPQKVFVRLDGAPLILHTDANGNRLVAHTGRSIEHIQSWWLDDQGHLYAQTDAGPSLVMGRDLLGVLEQLYTGNDEPVSELLESLFTFAETNAASKHPAAQTARGIDPTVGAYPAAGTVPSPAPAPVSVHSIFSGSDPVLLHLCPADDIERRLGFVRQPGLGYA